MSGTRKGIPRLTVKRLMQECGGACPFCNERDVSTFECHHIDGDRSNRDYDNLIEVCASCHSKIEQGTIGAAVVKEKKWELKKGVHMTKTEGQAMNVAIHGSSISGDIAQNIYKVLKGRRSPPAPTVGTIRANIAMKAYVDYLLDRYHTYRKADPSFDGGVNYNYALIQVSIRRELGANPLDLPEHKFGALTSYLQRRIDKTIRGRVNVSRRVRNYHSFGDHHSKFDI